ncbi:phosphoribosyltransferase [archaeon]|nr:phosphoribosyltransferase [archaeon]
MLKCKQVSQQEINQMIKQLYQKIKKAHYKPDVIIAIARGGYQPASQLCDYLGVKELESVKVTHWNIPTKKNGQAEIQIKEEVDMKNKKILIVDDISDTGESLKLVIEYVKKQEPLETKTAVMQVHQRMFKPDFHGNELQNSIWMIYPWTIYEDYKEFIKELTQDWKTVQEIKKHLKEQRNLEPENSLLEEILEDMHYWKEIQKQENKWKVNQQ